MHLSLSIVRPLAVASAFAVCAAAAACSAPGSSPPAGATGSGNGSGSASSSGGAATTSTGPVSVPFNVSDVFVPSGFMGDAPADFNAIKMSSDSTLCLVRQTGAKGSCYTIAWTPELLQGAKSAWVGVYWQYPSNNWGAKPGKTVGTGASKVTFSAAGAAGGEEVEFLVGGVNAAGGADAGLTYADTFTANKTVTLTTGWTQYEIPLTGDSYTSVIGGFAWTITASTTTPVTFYIDDIEWE